MHASTVALLVGQLLAATGVAAQSFSQSSPPTPTLCPLSSCIVASPSQASAVSTYCHNHGGISTVTSTIATSTSLLLPPSLLSSCGHPGYPKITPAPEKRAEDVAAAAKIPACLASAKKSHAISSACHCLTTTTTTYLTTVTATATNGNFYMQKGEKSPTKNCALCGDGGGYVEFLDGVCGGSDSGATNPFYTLRAYGGSNCTLHHASYEPDNLAAYVPSGSNGEVMIGFNPPAADIVECYINRQSYTLNCISGSAKKNTLSGAEWTLLDTGSSSFIIKAVPAN